MPTFVHHQWSLFTLADLLRIDFTKLRQIPHEQIKLRVGYIFNFLECTAVKKLLLDLKGDNLTVLFPFLEREHLQILTPEQIDTIDFTKIMKENDRGSQNIWHHIAGREQSEKDKKAFFQSLNSDNVQALAPFFDKYAFDELSVEQIAHVDFTKCNMNGWMFSEIFSTGPSSSKQFAPDNFDKRILHIKGPSLMHLLQFFNEFNWGQLNNEQWASIQADQLNQATREGYDKEKLRRKA